MAKHDLHLPRVTVFVQNRLQVLPVGLYKLEASLASFYLAQAQRHLGLLRMLQGMMQVLHGALVAFHKFRVHGRAQWTQRQVLGLVLPAEIDTEKRFYCFEVVLSITLFERHLYFLLVRCIGPKHWLYPDLHREEQLHADSIQKDLLNIC